MPKSKSSASSFTRKKISAVVAGSLMGLQILPAAAQSLPQNLDLSSTRATVAATNSKPEVITVGGVKQTVQSGMLLTPAQNVALSQVSRTGQQSLLLGVNGTATGGNFFVSNERGPISGLTVPAGVTALNQVSLASSLNIAGALTNAGRFFSFSSNPNVFSAVINATNIVNQPGALISTVIPSSLLSITGAVHPLDLSLNAVENIVNAGTISSSGALCLSAAAAITNALPTGTSAATPVMSAVGNLNLNTNNLANAGLIRSSGGDINLTAQTGNIVVNNTRGTLEALSGVLNVRDASFTEKSNFTLTGGDILSKAINAFSGCGTVDIDAHDITGLVNINAGVAHVTAETPRLSLGNITLSGDPTFYNSAGDVVISSDLVFVAAPLAIVASGNILSSKANLNILTSSTGGGAPITLIAGVDFKVDNVQAAGQVDNDNTTILTLIGSSVMGGKIDLTGGGGPVTIAAQGQTSNAAGADIQLVAFAGSNAGTGAILFPANSEIYSSGADLASGDVTLLAGARGGTAISNVSVFTDSFTNSTPNTGSIILRNSTPIISGTMTIKDGSILTGAFAAGPTQYGSISPGQLISSQAPILVLAGNNINLSKTVSTGGQTSGTIGLFAAGNIQSTGSGFSITSSGVSKSIAGGDITIVAGANTFSNSGLSAILVTGGSTTGGSVDFVTGGSIGLISSSSGNSPGADSGNIAITAFQGYVQTGTANGSGKILLPNSAAIIQSSAADPTSLNGNVVLIAESSSGNGISVGGINASGGVPGSGVVSIVSATVAKNSLPLSYNSGPVSPDLFGGNIQNASIVVGNTISAGASVSIATGSDLTVGSIVNKGDGTTNGVTLGAGGTLTTGPIIDVSPSAAGGQGGSISLTAKSFQTAAPTFLNVAGTGGAVGGSGNGGSAFITGTDASKTVTIGTAGFSVDAVGDTTKGDGGSVSINSAGNILYDPFSASPFPVPGSNGNGGKVTLAGSNINVQADLQVNGDGTGNGGEISITTNSSTPFVIGTPGTNGSGNLNANGKNGGQITVLNSGAGGIQFAGGPAQISASSSTSLGASGNIVIDSTKGVFKTLAAGDIKATGGAIGSLPTIKVTAQSFDLTGLLQLDASSVNANFPDGGSIFIGSSGSGKTAVNAGTVNVGIPAGQKGGFGINISGNGISGDAGSLSVNSAANLNVETSAIAMTVGAGGDGADLAFMASQIKGNLFINGNLDLSGAGGNGGSLLLYSKSTTPFTIGPSATINGLKGTVSLNGTNAGAIKVANDAGGITIDGASLIAIASNGQGANLNLSAAGNVFVTSTLNASGSSGFNAGVITIASSSSVPFNIGGATAAKPNGIQGSLIATSDTAAGGNVNVSNAKGGIIVQKNAIDVDTAFNSFGGIISLSAPASTVFVDGDLTATSPVDGGRISITSSNAKFTIDPTAVGNGITGIINATGNLTGGSIYIKNAGGSIIQSQLSTALSVTNPATATNGGYFTLEASKGAVLIKQGIGLDVSSVNGNAGAISILSNSAKAFALAPTPVDNGVISLNAGAATNGGSIVLSNLGSGGLALGNGASLNVSSTGTGDGGNLIVSAGKGAISLSGGLNVNGPNGAIRLQAASYNLTGAGPVVLSVNGVLGNNAGDISVYSTKALSIGSTGTGKFDLQAQGDAGAGNGGIITVSSADNLTIDPTGLKVNAPNGSHGTLNLSGKNVRIGAGLSLDAGVLGAGGKVNIVSNSAKPFIVGNLLATDLNGINGGIDADGAGGGTIGIRNNGTGGILINDPAALTVAPTLNSSNAGTLDFQAPVGTITFSTTNSSTLSANALSASSIAGTIVINAKAISVTGPSALQISANSPGSTGGFISVTQTSTALKLPLSIGNAVNQLNMQADGFGLKNNGFISVSSGTGILITDHFGSPFINPSASVDILLNVPSTSKSTIKTSGAGYVRSDILTLKTGTGNIGASNNTNPLDIAGSVGAANFQAEANSLNLFSSGGSIFVENNQTSSVSISGSQKTLSKVVQTFTVGTHSDIVTGRISASPTGTLNLVGVTGSNADIVVGDSISAANVNLFAEGTGGIQGPGNKVIVGSNSVSLNSGLADIGQPLAAVFTATSNLALNTNKASAYVFNSGNLQTLSFGNMADVDLQNAGYITVNSPLTGSNISLATTFGSGSIILKTTITATNDLKLSANGFGSIVRVGPSNTLSATTLTLKSEFGNIGTSVLNKISTSIDQLSASTGGGSIFVSNSFKSLTVNSASAVDSIDISAGGSLNVIGNVGSSRGHIGLSAFSSPGNSIVIGKGVTVAAGGTGISIQNTNGTDGLIDFQAGSALLVNGNIRVEVGLLGTGSSNTPPANVTVNGTNAVFEPTGTITASAPQNLVNAVDGPVRFFNPTSSKNITFGGGVTFTAGKVQGELPGLNLADSLNLGILAFLQTQPGSGVTGSLFTTKDVTFDSTVNLSGLNSLNVPAGYTMTFTGVDSSRPLAIHIPSQNTGTSKTVVINGKVNFISDGSTPTASVLSISSDIAGLVLNIGKSGQLKSDGDLSLNIGGNSTLGGTLSAAGKLALFGSAGNNAASTSFAGVSSGSISITGNVSAGLFGPSNALFMISTGGISQTAGSIKANTVLMAVTSSNPILQKGGTLSADGLVVSMGTGSATMGLTGKNALSVRELAVTNQPFGLANVSIKDSVPVNLSISKVGGAFAFEAPSITVMDDVSFGSAKITTTTLKFPSLNSSLRATDPLSGSVTIQSQTGTAGLTITGSPSFSPIFDIDAAAGLTISSAANLSLAQLPGINDSLQFSNKTGVVSVTAKGTLAIADTQIYSGSLNGVFLPGAPIAPRLMTPPGAVGSISLASTGKGALSLDNVSFNSNAGDIQVKSNSSMILGTGGAAANLFASAGGNIRILSAGAISQTGFLSPSNRFYASALGAGIADTQGGTVDISAGSNKAATGTAALTSGTRPFGTYSDPNNLFFGKINGTSGAVSTQVTTGGALGAGLFIPLPQKPIDISGGVILLRATGKSGQLGLFATEMNVQSFSPMSYEESVPSDTEFIVNTGDDAENLEDEANIVKAD